MPGESQHSNETPEPNIVIVGAGFAGLSCARALKDTNAKITVIDRHNYHLFQPLLYQVATASLSPADIAQPIRSILKDQANTRVLLGEVTAIDKQMRQVTVSDTKIPFDYLVVATGARHGYFGKDHWAEHAPGIKTVDDATRVRADILMAFERAEAETDPARRKALLTFVVIGGGPTGVEMAGAIAELARNSITHDFRSITPRCASVILVEAGPRLLPTLPEALSIEARNALERLGVEVRTGEAVTDVASAAVTTAKETIAAHTIIWGAGVRASAAGSWLDTPTDRVGRVVVNRDFSIPGYRRIFVAGDTAAYRVTETSFLPGVAAAAKQAGRWIGQMIAARIAGRIAPEPFRYADLGSMATIGRREAVARLGRMEVKGLIGWLLWSLAHVYFLIGFRNRVSVAISWAWSYITYQRGVRLITGKPAALAQKIEEAA
jgi:NADH dehydrogenase